MTRTARSAPSSPPNGASCIFDFTGNFTGNGGDSQTDTVTACAVDNDGTSACDDDPATVTITEAAGGNLFHTGPTCQQFVGTAPPGPGLAGEEIEFVSYSVKNGLISQTDPGVFFYYSTAEGNGGSLAVTIDQTAPVTFNHPFAVQNTNNVRVFDANCPRTRGSLSPLSRAATSR